MSVLVEHVQRAVKARRHQYSDEVSLHLSLAEALDDAEIPYEREVQVTGGRIDFLVDGRLGLEVKVKGTAEALARQLAGYAGDERIERLLVVTTRSQHAVVRHLAEEFMWARSVPVYVTVIGALS